MSVVINTPRGNIGRALARVLLDVGAPLTVISRNRALVCDLESRGARVVEGSIDDRRTLDRALAGATALFWVTPTIAHLDYCEWARATARTAAQVVTEHGVQRIVHVSSAGLHGERGSRFLGMLVAIEEAFNHAAPHVVALRPGYFMENLLYHLDGITSGTFSSWAPPDLVMPMVAAGDIAGKAATYLLAPQWHGHRVCLVQGPQHLSLREVANVLTTCLGRPIRYQQLSFEQIRQQRHDAGEPAALVELELETYQIILDGRMSFSEPRTPESTTATTLPAFVASVLRPALADKESAPWPAQSSPSQTASLP